MAFHPYPQLIPQFCNIGEFGPPRRVSFASAWPWVDHPVSGLLLATQRPIQTRFRFGSGCTSLNLATESNSPAHSPEGTPSDLPAAHPRVGPAWYRPSTACKHTVSGSFRSLNKGSFHLSLTVLVHYRSPRVFSLGRWTSLLPTGLACPVVLKVSTRRSTAFAYEGLTPYAPAFQQVRLAVDFVTPSSRCYDSDAPVNPHPATHAGYHTRWV